MACADFQAVEPPAGQIRFTMPKVVELVGDLLNDALHLVSSSYFSTGGDEINAACYVGLI
jgi:hexosaminidase